MITKKDILSSVIKNLKTNFKNVEILSTDISEGIKRPSFFIEYDNSKVKTYNTTAREVTLTIRIYYFANSATDNKLENMEIGEKLISIFLGNYEVNKDFYVCIESNNVDIVDKVLQFSFDVPYIEKLEIIDEHELLENLIMERWSL